jgi:Flp pilus assembly protein CpaB
MYNGQTRFTGRVRRIVVNRRTGIAGVLAGDDDLSEVVVTAKKLPIVDDLSEVAVTARYWPTSAPKTPPTEYDDMQEIVVSGTRIPWWMWGIGGVLSFAVLLSVTRK